MNFGWMKTSLRNYTIKGTYFVIIIMSITSIVAKGIRLSGDERFQFHDKVLIESIESLGSINAFLEGNLLLTSNLQCKLTIFGNYSETVNRISGIKCRGLSRAQLVDNWQVSYEKTKDSYAIVNIQRVNQSTVLMIEYVIITCCIYTYERKYEQADALLVALPVVQHVYNLENLTDIEREYQEPHFLEISPCPCDITRNYCDTFCCCDQDCSSSSLSSFDCFTDIYGGNKMGQLLNWRCNHSDIASTFEFYPLLCIHSTNTPYLGLYFADMPKASDHSSISKILSTKQNKNAQHIKDNRRHFHQFPPNSSSLFVMYHYSDELQVVYTSYGVPRSTGLYLPVSIYSDSCILKYPVRFLVNQRSSCNVKVKEICENKNTKNTILDVNSFVKKGHEILQMPGSTFTVETNLRCVFIKNASAYVKFSPFSDNRNHSQETVELDSCPLSTYQNNVCKNVVVDVKYMFLWNGGRIWMRNISIIISDIPITKNEVPLLTQRVSVEFQYATNITDSVELDTNFTQETKLKFRSGNPGYEIGYPVLSGIFEVHNNDNYTIKIGNYLNLWNPSMNGFCESSTHRQVVFGENSFSGCIFWVEPHHLENNCAALRNDLLRLLEDLVPAEYLSKGGNPNLEDLNDFIQIIKDDFNETFDTSETNTCHNLTHNLQVEIVYAETEHFRGKSVWMIVGSLIRYQTVSWTPFCNMGNCASEAILFPLTSSVHFIRLPSPVKKVKRYWDHGEIEYCNREICFSEMFYPFTGSFKSDLLYQIFLWSLMILAFILSLLWLTRKQFY